MSAQNPETAEGLINIESLPEEQRDIFDLYVEAFEMPRRNPQQADEYRDQIELVNELSEETFHDGVLTALLRQTAELRVRDAKAKQEIRLETAEKDLAPQEGSEKFIELPDLDQRQVLSKLGALGVTPVKGGKGSHQKVTDTETGKTTTVPKHMSKKLLRKILKQLDISSSQFTEND